MPAKRTSMRLRKDVLRLKFESDLSLRQIAHSLNIGLGTVSLHLNQAKEAGLTWPLLMDLDDNGLERALFPNQLAPVRSGLVEPDYAVIHKELKHKGVTKQLLWEEYKQAQASTAINTPSIVSVTAIGCSLLNAPCVRSTRRARNCLLIIVGRRSLSLTLTPARCVIHRFLSPRGVPVITHLQKMSTDNQS
jgi:hypothetical protein